MKIFVLGLRRSGTTLFWRTLKQDARLFGYNEPFNPLVRLIGNAKWYQPQSSYYGEYKRLLDRDKEEFWMRYSAIHGIEEIQSGFSDKQYGYLKYLLGESENVLMEETRCHFKIADLARAGGDDSILIHLFRSPESFASSHFLPSGQQIESLTDMSTFKKRLLLIRNLIRKRCLEKVFWKRKSGYDNWGVETIVGEDSSSLFAFRLRECGLDPNKVYNLPAIGKLMAFWNVAYQQILYAGEKYFKNRFLNVHFEQFCRDPAGTIKTVYSFIGKEIPQLDFSKIKAPNGAFRPNSYRWDNFRRALKMEAIMNEHGVDAVSSKFS